MDSLTYWKNREAKQRQKNIQDQKQIDKEIEDIYSRTLADVQKEIDAFYGKYAEKEGITISEAKKRVSKLDMDAYSAKAKKYVKEHDFSDEANEEMRLYNLTMKVNRLEMLKANIGTHLVGGFDEMDTFGEKLTDRAIDEFERQAGILGDTVQDNNKKAASIVNASFHNATYSERIWMHQDLLKAEIAKNLRTGLIQGKNPRVLAQDIRRTFGSSQYNAERLMRTEMARVQTDAQMQSFKENGFDEYQFLALGNACEICRALDGKHFPVDKMMPGLNAPPMHPNCRCSTSAYMNRKEFDQWLNEKADGRFNGSLDDWKAQNYKPSKSSGGISGAWNDGNDPFGKERQKIADDLYEQIKNRDKKYEIEAVAKHSGLSLDDVSRIYDHIFVRMHLLHEGSQVSTFDADYYMAHSWRRLRDGKNIQKHDITMLKHKLAEEKIMGKSLEIQYEKAHNEATKMYNYQKELLAYLKDHDV